MQTLQIKDSNDLHWSETLAMRLGLLAPNRQGSLLKGL